MGKTIPCHEDTKRRLGKYGNKTKRGTSCSIGSRTKRGCLTMSETPLPSLPPEPLPPAVLDQIAEHDQVKDAFPMMEGFGEIEGTWMFILDLQDGAEALVLAEDGGGWIALDDVNDIDDAMMAIQVFQEQIGITELFPDGDPDE